MSRRPFTHPVYVTTGLSVAELRESIGLSRNVIITREAAEVTIEMGEGEGCEDVVSAVESIVCAAAWNGPSLAAKDILTRWHWYGVPMPPKPPLDEVRAAMVVAAEKPGALVVWANRERVEAFRDPKNSPTGDAEPRLRAANPFVSLRK